MICSPIAGGCTEDCKYCSQSSSYKTPTKASRLVNIEPVLEAARQAKANGSTRFCMGAAWRDLAGKKSGFEKILEMVKEVRGMGMEGKSWRKRKRIAQLTESKSALLWVCSLLNKLSGSRKLVSAPITTTLTLLESFTPKCVSPFLYYLRMANIFSQVITSRSYDDRLSTIAAVREAGISVCSGGILGLGEQDEDRVGLIHEVSR